MNNPNAFISSLAGEELFFMGNRERVAGWSATDGWVCPSNEIVDLYTQKQIDGGKVRKPTDGLAWEWTRFEG